MATLLPPSKKESMVALLWGDLVLVDLLLCLSLCFGMMVEIWAALPPYLDNTQATEQGTESSLVWDFKALCVATAR